jgi:ubiquinone/menaquinone biosynthesis C-methylase UbiE
MVLTPSQARKFYDRFGSRQDSQAFYEDAALDELIDHAAFEHCTRVFEFGCGTGRFAERLLEQHLPADASYFGIDISRTMIDIANRRLSLYADRASVEQSDGAVTFPLPDQSVDRVVSTYVLDLLAHTDIQHALAEARRVLVPGGKLCLVSLTSGKSFISRFVSGLWSTAFRLYAPLVGGCRPIQLEPFVSRQSWVVEYRNVISQVGVASEVLVARSHGNAR